MEALDELVLDEILRHVVARPQDHGELNARVAEGVVADERREPGHAALDLPHHLAPHVHRDALDVPEIRPVAHADLEQDRLLGVGEGEVRGDGGGELRVRDDRQVVRQLADGRVAPGDVLHVPFLARTEPDEVSRAHLAGEENVNPGEQVGQRVLQGEPHGQPAHAQGGEQRGNRDPERVEHHQPAQREDGRPHEIGDQVGRGEHPGRGLRAQAHQVAREPGQGPGDGHDQERDQRALAEPGEARGKLRELHADVQADHGAPQHQRPAHRGHHEVVGGGAGAAGGPSQASQDDVLQEQPEHEPPGGEAGRQGDRGELRKREGHRRLSVLPASAAARTPPSRPGG